MVQAMVRRSSTSTGTMLATWLTVDEPPTTTTRPSSTALAWPYRGRGREVGARSAATRLLVTLRRTILAVAVAEKER